MVFSTPAPLVATAQILYEVAAESRSYRLATVCVDHFYYNKYRPMTW